MEVDSAQLKIHSVDYDLETGKKLEPEEKPTETIYLGAARVSGSITGEQLGILPTKLSKQANAIAVAEDRRYQCILCKNFDIHGWRKRKAILEANPVGRVVLRQLLYQVRMSNRTKSEVATMTGPLTPFENHDLSYLGYCKVLSEATRGMDDLDGTVTTPVSPRNDRGV